MTLIIYPIRTYLVSYAFQRARIEWVKLYAANHFTLFFPLDSMGKTIVVCFLVYYYCKLMELISS